MHHRCPVTSLLLFFLSIAVPSARTKPTNNSANTIFNTTSPFTFQPSPASNEDVTCTPFRPFHFRPTYQDCSAAIRLLPDSLEPGAFHTVGLANQFKLPVNKISRTCKIYVRLVDGYTGVVIGTWREIRDAAAVVAETCYNGRGIESTGGEVLLGTKILISLFRADSIIVSGVENETIAWED